MMFKSQSLSLLDWDLNNNVYFRCKIFGINFNIMSVFFLTDCSLASKYSILAKV